MRYPLKLKCNNCSKEINISLEIEETSFEINCPYCQNSDYGSLDNNLTIGPKLLERSLFEISKNNDYSLSIVFSAISFECELSRLYNKWHRINSIDNNSPYLSDEELEGILRKYFNIITKIEEASKLMDTRGFDKFVIASTEFQETIKKGFPSLNGNSLSESIQKTLFWPRNRILHMGITREYEKSDAIRCYNIALLGITIFKKMDEERGEIINGSKQ